MATLLELRTQARQRADMVNSQFVSDAELTGYINGSAIALYDLFVKAYEDYFSLKATFTITNGNTYSLPADLYKLRGIDYAESDGTYSTILPFNFQERNRYDRVYDRLYLNSKGITYRPMGNTLYLMPSTEAAGDYQLWYIPRFTRLSADGDQLANVLDFEEYVVVDAAIKMKDKEESDCSILISEKDRIIQRVTDMVANRDVSAPERVTDVTGYLDDFFFPRR